MKQTVTAIDAIDAIDASDALIMKLRQAKAVATLIRTSGSDACSMSVTTAAGLMEDLLDDVESSSDALYKRAKAQ